MSYGINDADDVILLAIMLGGLLYAVWLAVEGVFHWIKEPNDD